METHPLRFLLVVVFNFILVSIFLRFSYKIIKKQYDYYSLMIPDCTQELSFSDGARFGIKLMAYNVLLVIFMHLLQNLIGFFDVSVLRELNLLKDLLLLLVYILALYWSIKGKKFKFIAGYNVAFILGIMMLMVFLI